MKAARCAKRPVMQLKPFKRPVRDATVLGSFVALPSRYAQGYYVPSASYLTVARDAYAGRACPERSEGILLTEQQVMSPFESITATSTTLCCNDQN
jgi:hypothetical protein